MLSEKEIESFKGYMEDDIPGSLSNDEKWKIHFELIEKATAHELFRIVLESRLTDVCRLISVYLSGNTERFEQNDADPTLVQVVRKMCSVKLSPHMVNLFSFTPEECVSVEGAMRDLMDTYQRKNGSK